MSNQEKYEFCSQAWVDFARSYLTGAAEGQDLSGLDMTFNEVFTDVPAHIALEGQAGRTGWYIKIQNGKLEVERGILDNPRLLITVDYETVLPLARMNFKENPELMTEAGKIMEQATADGKFKREGDETVMAGLPWAANLHDALAERTV
ncbi:MAG: hypothetical protein AAF512_04710 [Pseudomonadota bacterium]